MSIERLDASRVSEASETPEIPKPTRVLLPINREIVLDVNNFSVDYGTGEATVRAVHDVSFALRRATVLGVAGESGSGKSTLVYGMTRLLRAPGIISGGSVKLNVTSDDKSEE